jgi:hypothetical protein
VGRAPAAGWRSHCLSTARDSTATSLLPEAEVADEDDEQPAVSLRTSCAVPTSAESNPNASLPCRGTLTSHLSARSVHPRRPLGRQRRGAVYPNGVIRRVAIGRVVWPEERNAPCRTVSIWSRRLSGGRGRHGTSCVLNRAPLSWGAHRVATWQRSIQQTRRSRTCGSTATARETIDADCWRS